MWTTLRQNVPDPHQWIIHWAAYDTERQLNDPKHLRYNVLQDMLVHIYHQAQFLEYSLSKYRHHGSFAQLYTIAGEVLGVFARAAGVIYSNATIFYGSVCFVGRHLYADCTYCTGAMAGVLNSGELGELRLYHGQLLYHRMQLQYAINGVEDADIQALPAPSADSAALLLQRAYSHSIFEVRSGVEWMQESYTAALLCMRGMLVDDLLILVRRVRNHASSCVPCHLSPSHSKS